MKQVSSNLRLLRLMFNYSQEGVAASTGLKQQTISRIEKGNYTPHFGQLQRLAQCFGVPPSCLYERNLHEEMMDMLRND
jgi:transcriptional regulator with XRE-family HTH domain